MARKVQILHLTMRAAGRHGGGTSPGDSLNHNHRMSPCPGGAVALSECGDRVDLERLHALYFVRKSAA